MPYQRDPLRRQWGPLSSFRSLLVSLLFFVSNIRWFHLQATSRLRPGSTGRPTRAHLIVMTNLQGLELLRWGLGLSLGNLRATGYTCRVQRLTCTVETKDEYMDAVKLSKQGDRCEEDITEACRSRRPRTYPSLAH